LYQAFLGLQHVHEQGLVHRDLEPANLMVVPGGAGSDDTTLGSTVKVLDIGLRIEVPPGLQEVLDAMLAKDPALRFPTPGKAAQELRRFLVPK
jgi:serine/threonine protein kinase